MLIFIHLILYIFICSLQSITKNIHGIENSVQLGYTYYNEEMITINRNKRYIGAGGYGDPGGDSGSGDGGGGAGGCQLVEKAFVPVMTANAFSVHVQDQNIVGEDHILQKNSGDLQDREITQKESLIGG
uniref:Uncharacterized protein n=1 Tax=Meloidogyne enterolobii TaxID=390850 RepID=A0A6V7V956_MELEN|nr:unnamed protein product [Meloidogyne enterolobii]